MTANETTRRVAALVIAVMAWYALGLQLLLEVQNFTDRGESAGAAVWRFFVYFTNLTNLLVAIVMTLRAIGGRFAPSHSVLTGAAMNITMVGLIYHFLLAWQWHPTGWQWVANALLHYFDPVVVVLFWFAFTQKGGLTWRHALLWLSFPLAYLIYALTRGAFDGFYAYFFLDPPKRGAAQTAIDALTLFLPFALMSALYLFADARLAKRAA